MGLTNEWVKFYALERAGEKPVFPNMGRNYKAKRSIFISWW